MLTNQLLINLFNWFGESIKHADNKGCENSPLQIPLWSADIHHFDLLIEYFLYAIVNLEAAWHCSVLLFLLLERNEKGLHSDL